MKHVALHASVKVGKSIMSIWPKAAIYLEPFVPQIRCYTLHAACKCQVEPKWLPFNECWIRRVLELSSCSGLLHTSGRTCVQSGTDGDRFRSCFSQVQQQVPVVAEALLKTLRGIRGAPVLFLPLSKEDTSNSSSRSA